MGLQDSTSGNLMGSRSEWESGKLHSKQGRKGLSELVLAAVFLVVGFGVGPQLERLANEEVPEWVGQMVGGFGVLGGLIGLIAIWRIAVRLRFGAPVLELGATPLVRGQVAGVKLRIPRRVRLESILRARLSVCEMTTLKGPRGQRTRSEKIRFQSARYVRADGFRLEPEETVLEFELPIPTGYPDASPARIGDRFIWRLQLTAVTSGPDFSAEYELPVFGQVAEGEEEQLRDSGDQPTARELLELARFRVVETAGGLEAIQPLMPSPAMSSTLAVMNGVVWGGVFLARAAGAHLIFPLAMGLVGALLLLGWINSVFGRARLSVRHGELGVVNGLPGLGLRGSFDREALEAMRIAPGDRTGSARLFHLAVAEEAPTLGGRRVVAALPDESTAEALREELRDALSRAA